MTSDIYTFRDSDFDVSSAVPRQAFTLEVCCASIIG